MQILKQMTAENFRDEVQESLSLDQADNIYKMIEHYSSPKKRLIAELVNAYPDKYKLIADGVVEF